MLENIFVYVEKNKTENVLKYGMKLSEFANKILNINDSTKHGIEAYLAPKDNLELYENENYSCLRISTKDLKINIFNRVCENTELINNFFVNIEDYTIGEFEEPIALIMSSILPESIFSYNKIIDLPLIVENSKEFYYSKAVSNMLDSGNFSNYELYQMLLIVGEQKKLFTKDYTIPKLKIYTDRINGKKYTKKSNF